MKVHEYCKLSTFDPYIIHQISMDIPTGYLPGNAGFDALPPTSAAAEVSEAPTGLPRDGGRRTVGGLCQVNAEADQGIT